MTRVGLEQIPVFSWINCTPDWWGSWFHPQWLWREPWMSPAQAVHSPCWQVITLADTASDLLSVSVAGTRGELRSLEFESCVHPSPPLTMGDYFPGLEYWLSCAFVYTESFGISPHFYCFSAKLMRFCFLWESNRKTKVAKYPFSVKAETSPLALVARGPWTWLGKDRFLEGCAEGYSPDQ